MFELVQDESLTEIRDRPGVAKYEQLCDRLMNMVSTGRLKAGDALPPEPVLAAQLNVARSTVRQAFALMESNGLIRRVRGKGTFVHEDAASRLRKGLDVIALIIPEQSGFYPLLTSGFEEARKAPETRSSSSPRGTVRTDREMRFCNSSTKVWPALHWSPPLPIRSRPRITSDNCNSTTFPSSSAIAAWRAQNAPLIAFSGLEIGRLAGEALLRRKHQRVAFISALRHPMAELYETGLRRALEARDCALPAANVYYLGLDPYADLERYEKQLDQTLGTLMKRPEADRPTAIFTGFDGVAEAIYLHLMRMGVDVPGEMSLLSFGGAKRLSAIQYRLSAVTADEAGVGQRAAELLHEMRIGKREIDREERFEIQLGFYEGQTLASI